jgi:hypothetical protein
MLRGLLCAGLVVGLAFSPTRGLQAGDKSWEEAEAQKLQGRWTLSRERKSEEGKVRRYRLELEFTDGKLKLGTVEEGGGKDKLPELSVLRVEQAEGASRLVLSARGLEKGSVVYYAFYGDKLILVGNCPGTRPFEGFPLSGEFKREESTPK